MAKIYCHRHLLSFILPLFVLGCSTLPKNKEVIDNPTPSINMAEGGLINPLTYEELVTYSSTSTTHRVVMAMREDEQMTNAVHLSLFTNNEEYYEFQPLPYYQDLAINLDDNLDGFARGVLNMSFITSPTTSERVMTLLNVANYQYFEHIPNYTFTDYQSQAMNLAISEGDTGGVYLSSEYGYLAYLSNSLDFDSDRKTEFYFYEIDPSFIIEHTWSGFLTNISSMMDADAMIIRYYDLTTYNKHYLFSGVFDEGASTHGGDIESAWNMFYNNYSLYSSTTNNYFRVDEPQEVDFDVDYSKMVLKTQNKRDKVYYLDDTGATSISFIPLDKTPYGDYLLIGEDYNLLGKTIKFYYGIYEDDEDYLSTNGIPITFKYERTSDALEEATTSYKMIYEDDQTYTTEYLFNDSFVLSEQYYGDAYDFALVDSYYYYALGFNVISETPTYLFNYGSSLSISSYQDENFLVHEGLEESHQYILIIRYKEDEYNAPSKPIYYAFVDTATETISAFKHALIDNYESYDKYLNSDRFMSVHWRSEFEEMEAFNLSLRDMIIGYQQDNDIDSLNAFIEAQSFDHRYYIQFSYYLILVARYDYSTMLPDDHVENYYSAASEFLSKYEEDDFTSYEEVDALVDNYIASCKAISDDYDAITNTKYSLIETTNRIIGNNLFTDEEKNAIFTALNTYLKRIDELNNLHGDELVNALNQIAVEYYDYLMTFISGGNGNGR